MIQIIPTLFSRTEEEFVKRLEKTKKSELLKGGWVQLDLMDNKFVHNHSVSIEDIKKYEIPFQIEVQLMVIDPEEWINNLPGLNVDRIIFPSELNTDREKIIEIIKLKNMEVGLSLNPDSNISILDSYLNKINAVLLMGVEPGAEGREFNSGTFDKIRAIKQKAPDILVGVDGGVNDANIKELVQSGADYLAIGSFLFNGNIDENLEKLWEAVNGK